MFNHFISTYLNKWFLQSSFWKKNVKWVRISMLYLILVVRHLWNKAARPIFCYVLFLFFIASVQITVFLCACLSLLRCDQRRDYAFTDISCGTHLDLLRFHRWGSVRAIDGRSDSFVDGRNQCSMATYTLMVLARLWMRFQFNQLQVDLSSSSWAFIAMVSI